MLDIFRGLNIGKSEMADYTVSKCTVNLCKCTIYVCYVTSRHDWRFLLIPRDPVLAAMDIVMETIGESKVTAETPGFLPMLLKEPVIPKHVRTRSMCQTGNA